MSVLGLIPTYRIIPLRHVNLEALDFQDFYQFDEAHNIWHVDIVICIYKNFNWAFGD